GRPRPLPRHDTPNPAYHPHTLNYEEPPIVAKYELTIILGNCVRCANSWKPIALPAETNAIQKAWSLTPLPNSTAVECTFEDNPDFTFGTLETERWLPLAKLMSMNLDDAIQLYLTE
ncbi:hypothetical protein, partial [Schaalia odontolytica]|uniref:hypothetical protein n=1 Tax=Schaalia odontolytica TaxID=1660 RepID=UPI003CF9BA96